MATANPAYKMDSNAKKINAYENGKLTLAQTETLNSWLAQVNTMANNMKLVFAQSVDKINRPMLTSSAMKNKEDLPPRVTGTKNGQIEEDGIVKDAHTTKKPNLPNKSIQN